MFFSNKYLSNIFHIKKAGCFKLDVVLKPRLMDFEIPREVTIANLPKYVTFIFLIRKLTDEKSVGDFIK